MNPVNWLEETVQLGDSTFELSFPPMVKVFPQVLMLGAYFSAFLLISKGITMEKNGTPRIHSLVKL